MAESFVRKIISNIVLMTELYNFLLPFSSFSLLFFDHLIFIVRRKPFRVFRTIIIKITKQKRLLTVLMGGFHDILVTLSSLFVNYISKTQTCTVLFRHDFLTVYKVNAHLHFYYTFWSFRPSTLVVSLSVTFTS